MTILKKILKKPLGRYIFVGGCVYIFELIIIFIAGWLGASSLIAVGLSFWLGLFLSFGLQKFITFRDTRTRKKLVFIQLAAVMVLVFWNFGFTLMVTKVLTGHVPAAVSRTIALSITTLWNFYLYKTHIFTAQNSELID